MTRFVTTRNMGKVVVKQDKDGKSKLVRVRTYGNVSARIAAKKKKSWRPAK